jgi:hypothetical protein
MGIAERILNPSMHSQNSDKFVSEIKAKKEKEWAKASEDLEKIASKIASQKKVSAADRLSIIAAQRKMIRAHDAYASFPVHSLSKEKTAWVNASKDLESLKDILETKEKLSASDLAKLKAAELKMVRAYDAYVLLSKYP